LSLHSIVRSMDMCWELNRSGVMSVLEAERHLRRGNQHTDTPHRIHVRHARDKKAAVSRADRDLVATASGQAVRREPLEMNNVVASMTAPSIVRILNDPDRPNVRRGKAAGRRLTRVRVANGLPARGAGAVSAPRGAHVRRASLRRRPLNPNHVPNRHPGTPLHSQSLPKKERSVSMIWTFLRR